MKNRLWIFYIFLPSFLFAQNGIRKAEYFIDKDFGAGKCFSIPITEGDSINLQSVLLATKLLNLTQGDHTIGVRVKDGNGLWSIPVFKKFTNSWSKIVKAEYFIDKDFGAGKCFSIPITEGDSINLQSVLLATKVLNLSKGDHTIGVRVKDGNGLWSIPVFKKFTNSWSKIVKAEYFIDKDFGAGKCFSIPITEGDSINLQSVLLATKVLNLSKGDHTIGVRVKDGNGLWSIPVFKKFTNSWSKIVKAEYFIDKDFGAGKCFSIPIIEGDSINLLSVLLATKLLNLSKGDHTIGVRVKDGNGLWSIPVFKKFTVNIILTEIDTVYQNIALICFPNPASDKLFLQYNGQNELLIDLFDINGNMVLSTTLIKEKEIDVSKLLRGIYFLKFKNQELFKVILQ